MAAALQILSPTYARAFDSLPTNIREAVQAKVDEMGTRLYEFDLKLGRIYLHFVGHRREVYK